MQLLQSVQLEGFEPGFDSRADELRAQFRYNGRQKEPSRHPAAAPTPQANEPQVRILFFHHAVEKPPAVINWTNGPAAY